MTDYTALADRLKQSHGGTDCAASTALREAADAIEALQADVARLNANAQILQEMHEADSAENVRLHYEVDAIAGIKAERDALQAKLDAMAKQEPVNCALCGEDAPFQGTCGGGRSNPAALCYAAPKALEPLTDGQIESLVDVAYKHWQDKTTFDIGKVRSDFRSVPGIGSQQ